MLVSCPACSARFQLPDDKVRGRKARMKCKKCGEAIAIDGTNLGPSSASLGPPAAPSRRHPPSAPRNETLSFSEQTVALGAEEAAALSRQARQAEVAALPDLEDRITPVSSPLATSGLLDDSYVDAAMNALEQKVFSVPAPRPPPPSKSKPASASPPVDDDEATRMMDLPRLLSAQPAPPAPPTNSSAPDADTDEATRMLDLAGPTGLLAQGTGRRADKDGEEATRIFDTEPATRGPRLPPRPSLPRAPGPPTPAGKAAPASEAAVILYDPTPSPAPSQSREGALVPAIEAPGLPPSEPFPDPLTLTEPFASQPPPAPSAPEARPQRSQADLTVQRARLSSLPPATKSSNWGLYLFVAAIAATGALVAVYFLSRPTFDRAIAATRQTLGLLDESGSTGPAFDAGAAAAELARVAARAPSCKEPGGPAGYGRARVLFQMNGTASSAAVSPPFHASPSEACLLGLFKGARVPPFGGQPIIVTKTFRVD